MCLVTRRASAERSTSETKVSVQLDLEGGPVEAHTGVGFFDHMLAQLGTHSHIGLGVETAGDLGIDAHHTVEDTGLVLGEALAEALGDKRGIRRYGDALVAMEESLARVALDISGRALLVYEAPDLASAVVPSLDGGGGFAAELVQEFLRALTRGAGLTLHVALLYSGNVHHGIEAVFKGVGRALGDAVSIEGRAGGAIPSTKGRL